MEAVLLVVLEFFVGPATVAETCLAFFERLDDH